MKALSFMLPDGLVGDITQIAAQSQNTQIANYILENPDPKIPVTNSTLSKAQIELLMSAIDTHYGNATKAANLWQNGSGGKAVNDYVIDVMNYFLNFQERFPSEYEAILNSAYNTDEDKLKDALLRLQSILEECISATDGSITAISNYETNLSTDQTAFNQDYENILSELGTISSTITELKSAVSSLQENISENNKQVLDTTLDTAGSELEQGASLFTSAAEEDVGGVVSAGVQMGVAYVKGITKVIELNAQTVDNLEKIRTLSEEIDQDEVILAAFVNIGTMLVSLGGEQGVKLNIISDIVGYWRSLSTDIENLLASNPAKLSSYIDITNYVPENQKNSDFPPWNVTLPLSDAASKFNKVLGIKTSIFDNKTTFKTLSTVS